MREVRIGDIIKTLRALRGISQEALAEVCGVSMQAVSKWENNQSYPDITLLPVLSDYFQVSLDYLLTGEIAAVEATTGLNAQDAHITELLRDSTHEDILYIVQYRNGKILGKNTCDTNVTNEERTAVKIRFEEEYRNLQNGLHVEIWSDANIEGNVNGSVSAGGMVSCAEVNGSVAAGGMVNCAEVNGSVGAGGAVNCAEVNGEVSAGGSVTCGDVGGNVSAGSYVSCGDIDGDVSAGGKVTCRDVGGDVKSDSEVIRTNA